ncbi:hypothetical protein EV363DRAFT_1181973, partial [Boletus edulis]
RHRKRRTRTHIVGLLGMKKIVPRAIAYIAVKVSLQFALSSCSSWRVVNSLFNHARFYSNIVNWFKDIKHTEEKKYIDDLL